MPGVDFFDTYAPVARFNSARVLLSIVASDDLEMKQIDAVTAFLNGELEEEIYMKQAEGYVDPEHPEQVYKLNKAIYGLKQAGLAWFNKVDQDLRSLGLLPLDHETCIYTNTAKTIFVLVYVDDMLVCSKSMNEIDALVKKIRELFRIKEMEAVERFLGYIVTRDREQRLITLSQPDKVALMLERFGMTGCSPNTLPMQAGLQLEPGEMNVDQKLYQQMVGCLIYISYALRSDMTFGVAKLAQFTSSPTEAHMQAAKHMMRYLAGTADYKLVLGGGPTQLVAYTDSSFADNTAARSTGGHVFMIGYGAISWASKKQSLVALSSTEAEYIQATEATREAMWLRYLLADLGYPQGATPMYGDNKSTIALSHNSDFHPRTKHIGTRYHFIREAIKNNIILFEWVGTEDNVADIMTKPLGVIKFRENRGRLGLTE